MKVGFDAEWGGGSRGEQSLRLGCKRASWRRRHQSRKEGERGLQAGPGQSQGVGVGRLAACARNRSSMGRPGIGTHMLT